MVDYIEREAAIAQIDESLKHVFVNKVGKSIMNKIPAADVRPVVRASWEEKEKDGVWWYACSACGEHIPKGRWGQEWHSRFCPNCGAEMR